MFRKVVSVLGVTVLFMMSFGACKTPSVSSGSQFINSVSLNISQQGTASFINLTGVIDLGSAVLAEISNQIIDPVTQLAVGTISFTQLTNGTNQIDLSINTNVLSHASAALGSTLPNGNPLPFSLAATPGAVLGIPLLQNSVIYVGGAASSTIFAGVALSINGLSDTIGGISIPANIFFTSSFGSNLSGYGGIFTGASTSGIALFAKYSPSAQALQLEQRDESAKAKEIEDIHQLDSKTQSQLQDFFYGEPQELEIN